MVFLTGANGLVGSFIARKLLLQKVEITALVRPGADLSLIADIQSQLIIVEGDLSDVQLLDKQTREADTVIHCAAVISYSSSRKELMYKSNVEGTANIVNAALKNHVKRFCYISSIAALGRKKNTDYIDETALWEESSANTFYGTSKYLAELEVWRGIEEGLNGIIFNPSIVLGPGNWLKGSSRLFKYVFDENKFFPQGEMNFIDVRDVSDVVCSLLYTDIKGERFILNAGKMSYKDVFFLIADRFKKKRPSFKASRFLSEIAWRLEGIKSILTGKDPLLTKESVRVSAHNHTYSADKMLKFRQVNFRSIQDTINWTCDVLVDKNVNK